MWAGSNVVADSTWEYHLLDTASEQLGWSTGAAALSLIRDTIAVINYLNYPTVNAGFAAAHNGILAAFNTYADRIQAQTGNSYPLGDMFRTFFRNVIIAQRLEGTRNWAAERLEILHTNWQAELNRAVAAQPLNTEWIETVTEILGYITRLMLQLPDMTVNVSLFN